MNKVKVVNETIGKLNDVVSVKSKKKNKVRTRREAIPIESARGLQEKGLAARRFLWAFMVDKKLIKDWTPFYNRISGKNLGSILLEEYWRVYECTAWKELDIKLKWAAGQLIKEKYHLLYPHIELKDWVDITLMFKDAVLNKWAIRHKLIDDELLVILRGILAVFIILYDEKRKVVWLYPKEESEDIESSLTVLQVLKKEISLWYVNKEIGDRAHNYWYTHILRRNLQLTLQTWQSRLLIKWKQFNYVAGSRRIGKTYTSWYIAKRELYRKGWGYGARERQIIFICVSEEKMWQPLQYLLTMCKEDMALWFIKYKQKEKQFENTITWAKLIFRSAGSRTWAASYWADLVILDEAAMIGDQFWEDLLPIIIQEGATVFAISTINEDVKDNWFYRELVKAELELDDRMFAMRVTIDDNELLTEERKQDMKDALIHRPMKYWTQLYSIFPSGNTVFTLTWVIQPDLQTLPNSVVIWYDPWKIRDNAAVVIIDPNELRVIEEIRWYQVTYKNQHEMMKEIKKKYPISTIIMDRTGVGEGVAEIFGDLVDVSVKYKGQGETNFNQQFAYYQVSKMNLVEGTKLYFENFWLKINSSLISLIGELKWFQKISTGKKVTQYGWVWVKDDSVNALMLACFQMKHVLWIQGKNQVPVEWIMTIGNLDPQFWNWLFQYDEYTEDVFKQFTY